MILSFFCILGQLTSSPPTFETITNATLEKCISDPGLQSYPGVSAKTLVESDRLIQGVMGTFVIIRTNQGRLAKVILQPARQKVSAESTIPICIVERYETFRPGQDRAFVARGQDVSIFDGFRFSFDLGQVVPEILGGDVICRAKGNEFRLEALGQAKIFVPNKIPNTRAKNSPVVVRTGNYSQNWIRGKYKLHDDGRRSGELELDVNDNGDISGGYYSARDGKKYDVWGKVGTPKHSLQFTIRLPQAEQTFQGWIFTVDAMQIVGSSRLNEREAGFVAIRVDP